MNPEHSMPGSKNSRLEVDEADSNHGESPKSLDPYFNQSIGPLVWGSHSNPEGIDEEKFMADHLS